MYIAVLKHARQTSRSAKAIRVQKNAIGRWNPTEGVDRKAELANLDSGHVNGNLIRHPSMAVNKKGVNLAREEEEYMLEMLLRGFY